MCFFYLFALIFAGGGVYNLFRADWLNVLWGFGFALVLFVIGSLLGREELVKDELETWLLDNKTAILDGETLDFRGQPIALQTRLTRYSFLISFVIASVQTPTRHLESGQWKTKLAGLFCSVLTLLFGWWSLPTGPIDTVVVLFKNARGGTKTDVARLLNELEKARQKAASDQTEKERKAQEKANSR